MTDGDVCKRVRASVFVCRTSEAIVALACSGMVSLACKMAVHCLSRFVYICKRPCCELGAKYCTAASRGWNMSRCSSVQCQSYGSTAESKL